MGLNIAITGAGGYLGSCLSRYFKARGDNVFQLTSNPVKVDSSMPTASYSLLRGASIGFFAQHKINALIHGAWDFDARSRKEMWASNVAGSLNLFKQANAEKVQFLVFISTMSAYEGCKSLYGQAKLEIEHACKSIAGNHAIVRPGLIYSTPLARSGGMIGSVLKKVARGGVVPLVGGGTQNLYLTHEHDLARLIELLVKDPGTSNDKGYFIAANQRPYMLRTIVELLASTVGTKSKFLSVPWRPAWLALRTAEGIGFKMDFRSDSILSLVHQQAQPDFSGLPTAVNFRDFASAISEARA